MGMNSQKRFRVGHIWQTILSIERNKRYIHRPDPSQKYAKASVCQDLRFLQRSALLQLMELRFIYDGEETSPFQLRVRMVSPCRVRVFLSPGALMLSLETVNGERAEGSALTDCDSASSAHVCCSAPSSAEEEAVLGSRPNKLPSSSSPSLPLFSALKIFIGMVIKLFIAEALINITSLDPFLRSIHFGLA
ncbi:hypothetical protein DPX16_6594 [Anabarilius grahami]|uniref:Uncharacterized protein n=1 Tax=Anabarilius grahami TaxID=495550 RepID=A0A3N0XYK9_ANAGA|nr:hypothetical protein DPX16_6594 [Anabarilius grahami]